MIVHGVSTCQRWNLPCELAFTYAFRRSSQGRKRIAVSCLSKRQSPPFSPAECEGLSDWDYSAEALALPDLRSKILCVGRSHRVCLECALPIVRQHGSPANFSRTWNGHVCLVVPPASFSHLSLRSLPEPLLLDPLVPAHRACRTRAGIKSGAAFGLALEVLPLHENC
jgi:hypothetical protein